MQRLFVAAIFAVTMNSLLGCTALRQWNQKFSGDPREEVASVPEHHAPPVPACPPENTRECAVNKEAELHTVDLRSIAVRVQGDSCILHGRSGLVSFPCVIKTLEHWTPVEILEESAMRNGEAPRREQGSKGANRRHPPDVLILGSSTVNDSLGHGLARAMSEQGHHVQRVGKASTGLARPDFYGWIAEAAKIEGELKYVFIFLGLNDAQDLCLTWSGKRCTRYVPPGTASWKQAYSERVRTMTKHLCTSGVQHVVWLTPPEVSVRNQRMRQWLPKIRELQIAGAQSGDCGMAIDLGSVDDVDKDPGLRQRDGVHISPRGANKLLRHILPKLPTVR